VKFRPELAACAADSVCMILFDIVKAGLAGLSFGIGPERLCTPVNLNISIQMIAFRALVSFLGMGHQC
jgi:hypothetical protein